MRNGGGWGVIALETATQPAQLMAELLRIEHEMGRQRVLKKGPRSIDIDILLFGDDVVNTPELTIPHPRFSGRRFVLAPMVELAPELRDPASLRTMRDLLAGTTGQGVRKVEFRITTEVCGPGDAQTPQ